MHLLSRYKVIHGVSIFIYVASTADCDALFFLSLTTILYMGGHLRFPHGLVSSGLIPGSRARDPPSSSNMRSNLCITAEKKMNSSFSAIENPGQTRRPRENGTRRSSAWNWPVVGSRKRDGLKDLKNIVCYLFALFGCTNQAIRALHFLTVLN